MAKVMIEVDIPSHGSKAEAEMAVKRHFDPDWVAEWWYICDIIEQAENSGEQITEDEAREVLRLMIKEHDCNIGINWDVIDNWIDHVKKLRKEVA